jgi:hypothetical protein
MSYHTSTGGSNDDVAVVIVPLTQSLIYSNVLRTKQYSNCFCFHLLIFAVYLQKHIPTTSMDNVQAALAHGIGNYLPWIAAASLVFFCVAWLMTRASRSVTEHIKTA